MDQNTNQSGSQQGSNSQSNTISLVTGQVVVLGFELNDIAELNVNGSDLVFVLNSGEEVTLEDYATLGKDIESIEFAGGEVIPGDAYLNDFGDIDTAAGPGAGQTTAGGGVGSPPAPETSINDSLSKIGAQPDIFKGDGVEFSVDNLEGVPFVVLNPDFVLAQVILDETFLDGGDQSVSVDFSTAFISGYGLDGPGSMVYNLDLAANGIASGLFALGVDGAQGESILLQNVGGTIVGYTGEGDAYTEYFSIEVDGAGIVTFTHFDAIYHPEGGDAHNDLITLTLASPELLQLTLTVFDIDGQSASASLNLGQGVFSILDDGPNAEALPEVTAGVNLTEDDDDNDYEPDYPQDDFQEFSVSGFGPQSNLDTVYIDSAVIQGLFATPDFGEDGPGGVTYSLTVGNAETGLYLTNQRPDGSEQPDEGSQTDQLFIDQVEVDPQIILQSNEDGTLVQGVAGDGTVAFTVSINPETGEVTVTQLATLDHPNTEDHNDIIGLTGVAVTQSIIDADNDVDSATSADLNITFTDDGPQFINAPQNGEFEGDMVLDSQGDGVTVLHGTIVPEFGDNEQQGSSVDQLFFTHNGGPLDIALTSERYGEDVDGNGLPSNLDTYVHLYTAAGVLVASNDDGGPGFDSLLNLGSLSAGDYIIYVGAFLLDPSEALADHNVDNGGSFEGTLGSYRVTLTGDVAPLSIAEVDETAVRENPHVEGIAFGNDEVDGSFSFEVGADKTNAALNVDGTLIQLYDENGVFVAQNTTISNDWRDISLEFSENSFTGEITVNYLYTLTDAYPHESDPNSDEYTDHLPITVIDGDGDTVSETISVVINDDMPYVLAERETERIIGDETDGLVVFPETFGTDASHDFDVRFGADGPNAETPIVLAMGPGDNYLWVEDTAGGTDIGTLYYSQDNLLSSDSLDDNNATWKIIVRYEEADSGDNHDFNYQFVQLSPIAHDDTTDHDETAIWDVSVTIMDGDGDTAESAMVIKIDDDGPTLNGLDAGREGLVYESALRENVHVEGKATTSGRYNEVEEGTFTFDTGTDEPGASLTIADTTFVLLANDDSFTVDTAFGEVYAELTYDGDGAYTVDWRYTLTTVPDNDASTQPQVDGVSLRVDGDRVFEDITVVITDGDGDTTSNELNIKIVDDEPFVINNPERIFGDETGSLVTASGDFDVRFGADGASLTTPIVLDMGPGANHLWVEDTAGGDEIGTLYYSQDGSIDSANLDESNASWKIVVTYDEASSGNNHDYNYQFVQLRAIDHPNPESHDEPVSWRVGVTTMDGDGDTIASRMIVRIEDDGPVIISDDIEDIGGYWDDESFGMVSHSGHALVDVDYGTDSDGHIELALQGNEAGLAVWDQDAGTLTYYQYATDESNLGQATWVVTVNEDPQNPGSFTYDFDQLDNIHHSNPNDHDEAENYSIRVTAFDGDGDSVVAGQTLDIRIEDSGVSILNLGWSNEGTVYESALRDSAEGEGNPTQYHDEVASGYFKIYTGADKSGDVGSVATLSIAGNDIPLYDANDNFIGAPGNIDTSFGSLAVSFVPYGNSGWVKVNWTYTLEEVPDGDGELPGNVTSYQNWYSDGVQEHIAVVLTDSDGDSKHSSLDIKIVDDGPSIGYNHTHVNEDETDDLGGVAITAATGVLDMFTGADGLGSVELSLITDSGDQWLSDSQKAGSFSEWDSGSQTLTYYQDGAGTDPTWTVEVFFNATTGQYNYNFTQLDAVDHANPSDHDETANFLLNVTLTDGDGDDASTVGQWWGGQLRLSIDDDGPEISVVPPVVLAADFNDQPEAQLDSLSLNGFFFTGVDYFGNHRDIVTQNGTLGVGILPAVPAVESKMISGQRETETLNIGLENDVVGKAVTFNFAELTGTETAVVQFMYQGEVVGNSLEITSANNGLPVSPTVLGATFDAIAITATGSGTEHVRFLLDSIEVTTSPFISVDETDFVGDEGVSSDSAFAVADLFDWDAGTDGLKDVDYEFVIDSSVSTGLETLDGTAITLQLGNDDNVIGFANGEAIFTISLNNEGGITLTQHQPMKHADPEDHDDRLFLAADAVGLVAIVTDGDDDTADATYSFGSYVFEFKDDGPSIDSVVRVRGDETGNLVTASGTFDIDFGTDGAAASGAVSLAMKNGVDGVDWTWDGQTLTYYQDGDADQQGVATWQIVVSETGGVFSYDFTQLDAIDHGNTNKTNEWSPKYKFILTATDGDGDVVTQEMNVRIRDDAPVAEDDTASITEDAEPNTVDGNVLTGAGADSVGTDVNANPVTTFYGDLDYGRLELDADGSFKYILNNNNEEVNALNNGETLEDEHVYTITDGDGDTTTATLTITINGNSDTPPEFTVAPTSVRVSEEGLEDGIKDDIGFPDSSADTTNAYQTGGVSGNLSGTFTVSDLDTDLDDLSVSFSTNYVTALNTADITSGGVDVEFVISDQGQTLTGYLGAGRTEDDRAVELTLGSIDSNTGEGSYDVTLYQPFDHEDGLGENLLDLNVGIEVTDGETTPVTANFNVTIEDDSPVSGIINHTLDIAPQHTNLMFVIDTSGSMAWDADTGSSTITTVERMELLLTSVREVITSYDDLGDIRVQIVTFDSGSDSTSRPLWLTGQEALDFIGDGTSSGNPNGRDPVLDPGGGTNYDLGVSTATSAFDNLGKLDGVDYPADHVVKNVSYFLSDGQPTTSGGAEGSTGITGTEITNWTNFLTANEIDSYAVGFGSHLNQPLVKPAALAALDPIAYDGIEAANGNISGAERDGHIVETSSELADDLLATIAEPVTGAIFGDMNGTGFGADGGDFLDITIDGVVYAWDGTANGGDGQISVDGDASALAAGSSTTITTLQDGKLWIDFATGEYSYIADPEMPVGSQYLETFTYTIEDFDGDPGEGTVNLNISRGDYVTVNEVSLVNFAVEDHLLEVGSPVPVVDETDYEFKSTTSPAGGVETALYSVQGGTTINVELKVTGSSGDDFMFVELYKDGENSPVARIPLNYTDTDISLRNGQSIDLEFDVVETGSYFIKFGGRDLTQEPQGRELKATIQETSYIMATQLEWQGVIPAEGNLFGAHDFGNSDPVDLVIYDAGVIVPFISGVATVTGVNGVTTIEENGDYRYEPTAETDFVGNPGDGLSFALVQGNTVVNGTLDFEIKDYLGGTDGNDQDVNAIIGTGSNEALYGYEGDDEIDGGAGNDVLHGGLGVDILNGGEGNDFLYGGDKADEADTLTGGDGEDIFIAAKGDTLDLVDTDDAQDTIYIATDMLQSGDEGVVVNVENFVKDEDNLQFEAGLTLSLGSDPGQLVVTDDVSAKTMTLQFEHSVDISSIISDASMPTPEEMDVVNSIMNSHG